MVFMAVERAHSDAKYLDSKLVILRSTVLDVIQKEWIGFLLSLTFLQTKHLTGFDICKGVGLWARKG